MKRLLVVTYYWPPAGGVAVQRTLKFCKYLPELGWQPVVLTVKNGNPEYSDPTLLEEIASLDNVVRARTIEPHSLYSIVRKSMRVLKGGGLLEQREQPANLDAPAIGEWIRLNLFIPDTRIGWIPFALKEGRRMIRELRPNLIYSSAPPFSVHLVARRLARAARLPWVADFRDPWLENTFYNTQQRTPFSVGINRRLETACLRAADRIITVGPRLAGLLSSKLYDEAHSKVHIIPNGYDVKPSIPERCSERFLISYFGSLYERRYPDALFYAVKELCSENERFRADALFRFYGTLSDGVRARIERDLFPENYTIQSPVPHEYFRELVTEEQILTLSIDNEPNNAAIIVAKTFDYLPSGNPIIGVGPVVGDTASVLNETRHGVMFDYGDADGVKREIRKYYRRWQAGESFVTSGSIERFQRRKQAEELAGIFSQTARGC